MPPPRSWCPRTSATAKRPESAFETFASALSAAHRAITYAQNRNMTSQQNGSIVDGISETVASPIAKPNRDSKKTSFQFIERSPVWRQSITKRVANQSEEPKSCIETLQDERFKLWLDKKYRKYAEILIWHRPCQINRRAFEKRSHA